MSIGYHAVSRPMHKRRQGLLGRDLPWQRRLVYLAVIYIGVCAVCLSLAEVGFRLFWNPRYWIHTSRLLIGSGQTQAGKKWWPETNYSVESSEFRTEFRTNALGYRARLNRSPISPYRVAFVGDSFTEGMQVAQEATFCAQLETLLGSANAGRAVECENFGVSATDLFDYWHRIVHDVLSSDPPDALVLCIYPGNDFQGELPDSGFDADDRPLRDYYRNPSWAQHLIAWVNLHSKFGCYSQRALLSLGGRAAVSKNPAPKNWWSHPALAARSADCRALRRSRSIFAAIAAECRERGTKLSILVVGPVATYAAVDGKSPLACILADWGIDIPVVDIAIKARALPGNHNLTFPIDGHLTESGHVYVARQAAPALRSLMTPISSAARSASERRTSGSSRDHVAWRVAR